VSLAKKIYQAARFYLLLLFLLGLIGVFAHRLQQSYVEQLARAASDSQNIANVLDEHALAIFQKADILLKYLAKDISPNPGGKRLDSEEIHSRLKIFQESIPEVFRFQVVKPDGNVLATSLEGPAPLNYSRREYFIRHRGNPSIGLDISRPIEGRTLSGLVLVLSRRLNNPDGSFAGVITATLEVSNFEKLFASLKLGNNSSVVLMNSDFDLIASFPGVNKRQFNSLQGSHLEEEMRKNPLKGTFSGSLWVDGLERIFSYRQVNSLPLIIIVGLAKKDILEEWFNDAVIDCIVLACFFAAIVFLAYNQMRLYEMEHKSKEQIRQLAYYDTLTNLPNRRLLLERLNSVFEQSKRFNRQFAVMFLDLDHFKHINDSLGHDTGDELLKLVAGRLETCVRSVDTVSRQGGDEFVIVQVEIMQTVDVITVVERILAALNESFLIQGHEIKISTSIGISMYPANNASCVPELMKMADMAMYEAKESGRNRFKFYQQIFDMC
jgi:diguanylate cyclase (GGDEF)-like protein